MYSRIRLFGLFRLQGKQFSSESGRPAFGWPVRLFISSTYGSRLSYILKTYPCKSPFRSSDSMYLIQLGYQYYIFYRLIYTHRNCTSAISIFRQCNVNFPHLWIEGRQHLFYRISVMVLALFIELFLTWFRTFLPTWCHFYRNKLQCTMRHWCCEFFSVIPQIVASLHWLCVDHGMPWLSF